MSSRISTSSSGNSKFTDKKSSPIGCLVFLAVIIIVFIYLPLAAGFTVAFGLFGVILLTSAISREFKRITERNRTNTSTIAAAQEGFVEISGKMVDEPTISTWLTGEKACIRRIDFTYVRSSRSSSSKSVPVTIFRAESERKKFLISDGSDQCWVILHAAELAFKKKTKRFRLKSLKEELSQRPLEGFSMAELDKLTGFKVITVTEEWLEKGQPFNCYGVLHKVKYGERPSALQEVYNHKNQHQLQKEQVLTEADWQTMEKPHAYGEYKVITSRYNDLGRRDIDALIISYMGDAGLNRNSYIQIILMTLALVFLIFMCGVLINVQHPELLEKLVNLI